ncbi:hypothetical protein [Mycolicibacterium sp.]|uniref:hypothetical protein n=1 Tax=Mycolicibacterium sp. TaxID=2320850 RepID=UPI001A26A87B|nr:hypothetical protein [Mycolicibacterium sp.]MBJ7339132.1 hypothetical protein [Mycolicibacterium sp.]
MRITLNWAAALLVSLGAVVAIVSAPIAEAAPSDPAQPHQACSSLGATQSLCESRGNVQINDSLPQVDYFPYAGGAT